MTFFYKIRLILIAKACQLHQTHTWIVSSVPALLAFLLSPTSSAALVDSAQQHQTRHTCWLCSHEARAVSYFPPPYNCSSILALVRRGSRAHLDVRTHRARISLQVDIVRLKRVNKLLVSAASDRFTNLFIIQLVLIVQHFQMSPLLRCKNGIHVSSWSKWWFDHRWWWCQKWGRKSLSSPAPKIPLHKLKSHFM